MRTGEIGADRNRHRRNNAGTTHTDATDALAHSLTRLAPYFKRFFFLSFLLFSVFFFR